MPCDKTEQVEERKRGVIALNVHSQALLKVGTEFVLSSAFAPLSCSDMNLARIRPSFLFLRQGSEPFYSPYQSTTRSTAHSTISEIPLIGSAMF